MVPRANHREERIKSEDMKVRIIPEQRKIAGEFYTGDILDDKIYDAELVEGEIPMYRIVDESGEAYGYFVEMFEIVEE